MPLWFQNNCVYLLDARAADWLGPLTALLQAIAQPLAEFQATQNVNSTQLANSTGSIGLTRGLAWLYPRALTALALTRHARKNYRCQ